MPRYFFHIQDGLWAPDEEGTELPDIYTAQAEAVRLSGEVLRDMGAKLWNGLEWQLKVADEGGEILFVLRFSAEERPALNDPRPEPDAAKKLAP